MKKQKGLSAWLVTWEWAGDHAKPPKEIEEILDPRLSPNRVREIVEVLYHRTAHLSEKAAWRLRKRPQAYPADFADVEGVKWTGQIICGHNPFLSARLVDNLVINTNEDGQETALWADRHSVSEIAEKVRRMKGFPPRST